MHIMVDLETLGTRPNSVILAIGAVKFDLATKQITDHFYCNINIQSCLDNGLTVDGDTLAWWLQQSVDARKYLFVNEAPLPAQLQAFDNWLGPEEIETLWGNGATFDNVILRSAYTAASRTPPWSHRSDRCYRTAKKLLWQDALLHIPKTPHYALDDATAQALNLMKFLCPDQ